MHRAPRPPVGVFPGPAHFGRLAAMKQQQSLELLEARIAPATLVSPTTVTFSDIDGDDVTIHISKPLFTAENLNQVLIFSDSDARADSTVPQSLSAFLVKGLGVPANGVDITVTAKRSSLHGGNGSVDMGGIDAFDAGASNNLDLGKVRVDGDLKFIDAGDDDFSTRSLKSLDVFSVGEFVPNVKSEVNGSIGVWKVRGNMQGSLVQSGPADVITAGKILIGGSLGRVDADVNGSGSLQLAGSAGTISIGHDLIGGVEQKTGYIFVNGALGSLKIGGSVHGGNEFFTGAIIVSADVGSIKIGGDLAGGPSQNSGLILVARENSEIGAIQIRGSIIGGNAQSSGAIQVDHARSIVVGHDLIGQSRDSSGSITGLVIDQVRIGGSMIGADVTGFEGQLVGVGSGSIFAVESIGSVTVGGDVVRANIVAGIISNRDLEFGPTTDSQAADLDSNPNIVSRISKITIKGAVNSGATGHYAIEANSIGAVRIGGVSYLHSDPSINFADGFTVDASQRFAIREL
jgi:hypothetical protein